jgi:hypothetical protein
MRRNKNGIPIALRCSHALIGLRSEGREYVIIRSKSRRDGVVNR